MLQSALCIWSPISRDEAGARPCRPRLLRSLTILLVVVASIYAVVWSCLLGSSIAGALVGVVAFAGLFVPSVHRWTGSFEAAVHYLTFLIFAPIVVLVNLTGGHSSPVFMWLVIVPVAAMTLSGPRAGGGWLALVLLETVLIGVTDPHQLYASYPLSPDALQLLNTTGVLSLSISIYLCLHADFRSLSKAHQRLRYQAHHDNLTGLLNRHALISALGETLSATRASGRGTALVLIDVDFFKQINDRYGHAAGDRVLKEIASRIRRHVRPTDSVGRFGGEEFLGLLPNCSPPEAHRIAESIREAIERTPFDLGESAPPVSITVSVGVSTCSARPECDGICLIQRADAALYEAKRNGRNQTRLAERRPDKLAAV